MDPIQSLQVRKISRVRVIQAAVAFGVLVGAEKLGDRTLELDWWLWVGAGTLVSASLIEPYFLGSRGAIGNSVAALGAAYGAIWDGVAPMWRAYVAVALATALSAVVVLLANPGKLTAACRWISTRFGRAVLLGFSALLIEVVRVSATDRDQAVWLALGVAGALAISSLDWQRLLLSLPGGSSATAIVELATEPNLILVSSDQVVSVGDRVRIIAHGDSEGSVVAQMAHRSGARFQVVLDKPWRRVVKHGNAECAIEVLAESSDAIGFAADGSTERTIEIHPLEALRHGQPLVVKNQDKRDVLYQVTGLRLERNAWDNSSVIEARARALQVGCVEKDGVVRFAPYLPSPYQRLLPADSVAASLKKPYQRLGVIAGTGIEIGLHPKMARGSHMAVLGMSGMGKTTVSRRLCEILKADSAVVALDGTGEYRNRLGFDLLPTDSDLTQPGQWVHEPGGDPPHQCRTFIKRVMDQAYGEYVDGSKIRHRSVLIEEAHSFLPEWNVATKTQGDAVNESCRFILQARKYGIAFIFVSQRTAVISKSALSQCESYIIFRTLDQTSLDFIEAVVGREYRETASSLARHQAICVGPAFNCSSPVIVDIDPAPAGP